MGNNGRKVEAHAPGQRLIDAKDRAEAETTDCGRGVNRLHGEGSIRCLCGRHNTDDTPDCRVVRPRLRRYATALGRHGVPIRVARLTVLSRYGLPAALSGTCAATAFGCRRTAAGR